ncbi:hypothetical protein DJ68_03035 [Halorubrum sp. C3]|nr:hypothetical protein DJ68_03035 [Halorubrum sp. C3]
MPIFDTPNSEATYTLPTTTTVEVFGAAGGPGSSGEFGGYGGYVAVEVPAGTTLRVVVGEQGGTPDGGRSPGGDGGNGGTGGAEGGGGGGATFIERVSDGVILAAAGAGGGASAVSGLVEVGGGGGARGGQGGASNVDGEDAAGAGVGGDGGDTDGGRDSNGGDGGTTTGGGVTVVEAESGYRGRARDHGEVVIPALPPVPTNVGTAYVADDEIELSFDDNGGTDPFEVEMRRDDGSWVSPAGGPSSPSSDGTYSYGPASDAAYGAQVGVDSKFEFRVRTGNTFGMTDWAYSDTVYTTPIPPHNPSVSRPDADTVNVSYSVKADQATTTTVLYRKDGGGGYGSWNYVGDTDEHGRSATGDRRTQTFTTSGNSWMDADSRYQFKIRHENKDAPSRLDSGFRYADYGNAGNVYFEDDFESGDLSAWDNTSGAVATTDGSHPNAADTGIDGADTGSYFATFDADGYVQKNLGDLTGETDVLVRCALATGSMDNASEYTEIQWYDGSSWNTLDRLTWASNEQGWVEVHETVPNPWLSADNRIRVIGAGGLGGGDQHAVDRIVVSDILHEYTSPAAPSNLSLDASTEREIGLTWENNAAFRDDNYVEFRRSSESDFEYLFNNGGATGVDDTANTIPGLLDGEEYDVKVQTKVVQNRRGEQYSSQFRTRSPVSTATTVLPAPTGLTVSGVTADSADYAWQASHNYGDTLVQYKPTDAGSWTTYSTVARDVTSATVTGLRNGEAYDARVVANTEHTQTEDDS